MEDKYFAILTNLDGLRPETKKILEVGSVYNIKKIEPNGDSFVVYCDVHGITIGLYAENVEVYKTYDGYDVIKCNPLENVVSPSQRGY